MDQKYEPPSGPPPGRAQQTEQHPRHVFFSADPPGHSGSSNYAPPPGPPPKSSHHNVAYQDAYEPPQGPPPSKAATATASATASDESPPPYHDWTVIPDTALLPPPPGIEYQPEKSPAGNATLEEADRAHAWTDANPLWPVYQLTPSQQQGLTIGYSSVIVPRELKGRVEPNKEKPGLWRVETHRKCGDACILSSVPLYAALYNSPTKTGKPAVAYFEVKLGEVGRDSGVALGFIAPPYPTWRLPGWERASLGVHGDDGRRFINDTWGGKDFVPAFKPGDTLGLGVRVGGDALPPAYNQHPGLGRLSDVEVFFTRNGKQEARWDLHEETDAQMDQPGGVGGLEGDRDLYAAIGVYGPCSFEMKFGRHNWLFRPEGLGRIMQ